jgi:SAM-dependent methyltransferase
MVPRWLEHPLTKGMPLDSPLTTELRRTIIAGKPFLRRIYDEWYRSLAHRIPPGPGRVLELGSGAGFFEEYVPAVIRSEVFQCSDVDVIADACQLPFAADSLRAIVMTDVFHHVPDVRRFMGEASRAVRSGGVIAMIEPWSTTWSRFIYGRLHHEPFRPDAERWEFDATGPLSSANGALPWIVFARDRATFEREFPQWTVEEITPGMPLRYLLSGGISLRALMPGWSFIAWRGVERMMRPLMDEVAMFATITLRRSDVPAEV